MKLNHLLKFKYMRFLLIFSLLLCNSKLHSQSNYGLFSQHQRWENAYFLATKKNAVICRTEVQLINNEILTVEQQNYLITLNSKEDIIEVNYLSEGIVEFYHFQSANYQDIRLMLSSQFINYEIILKKVYEEEELISLYQQKH